MRASAAMALGVALVLGGGLAAHADTVVCIDDGCDSGQWQAARGADNQLSYWGMGAGHDCTNYVAWKLSTNGVARPKTNPGNAADWAVNARADGYLVDAIPAPGAVAQWDAYTPGNPAEGHVAYVERVNGDGTILVSEDAWHPDGTGPLRFRTVTAASVSNFIHYGDTAAWLRQVVAAPGDWTQRSTGLRVHPTVISAVSMGGTTPQVAYAQDGQLFLATSDATGWTTTATTIASQSRSLSAVNMGGSFPTLVSLEGNRLMVATHGPRGWSSVYTGVDITGEMSAVNTGGLWPTILVSQGGDLYRVDNNGAGWFVQSTGLESTGAITAVSTGGALIDAFSVQDGLLYRLWFDGSWWHRDSTGVAAHGTIAATALDSTAQVTLVQDGTISLAYPAGVGWTVRQTGVLSGTVVTAADMGGIYPVVLQAG